MRIFLILLTFYSFSASADGLIDLKVNGRVEDISRSNAKSEIFQKVIQDVSLENISSLIGQEKAERNKEIIMNKVVKSSGKYILSTRGGKLNQVGKAYEMEVDLKLSLKNLRDILLQEGLLYQLEGPPKVLPVVRVIDRVNASAFSWWAESPSRSNAFVRSALNSFQTDLKEEFMKIGFYGMYPTKGNFGGSVPEAYRVQSPQKGDLLFIGEFFKSSVVLKGDIVFRGKPNEEGTYLLDFRLRAMQTQNGRVMAEVMRVFETDNGNYKSVAVKKFKEVSQKVANDLSIQLSDAWKKGTFGANLLRLVVNSKMPPGEIEKFKRAVVLQVRDIKALRERVMETRRVTFEMDASAPSQQLAQSLRKAKFPQYKVEVEDVNRDSVVLNVAAR